ncbi:MAG: Na+/H+ antiporter NhaA [Desulfuromonadales bacterium]|nr:Na+/H+ antiporter NhaA [Desulfuromonadales bacterium]
MPNIKIASLLRPFEDFFKNQASGGILLLATSIFALVLANSPLRDAYHHFWEIELTVGNRSFGLTQSLHHWINDGLMAVFFFVVGLEIKREFLAGELASRRKATLPIAAAIGGMIVPAAIFVAINQGTADIRGWGIPMATDIAFALGIIALLGDRISRPLAIFLTALAIVDDLGAVLVIAIFYTGDLSWPALGIAALFMIVLIIGNRLDLQHPNFYALIGLGLWVAFLKSGIHASIAGVLIGATIPVRARYRHDVFIKKTGDLLDRYKRSVSIPGPFHNEQQLGTLLALEHVCHEAMSPLQRMEHEMTRWIIYGVMPIFALANAGISLTANELGTALTHPITIGVTLGLFIGKPLGILLFAWLAVKFRLCDLPIGSRWSDIAGIGMLAGIGFTMSMFITNLAYLNAESVANAKVGIFIASILAGLMGYLFLARRSRYRPSD